MSDNHASSAAKVGVAWAGAAIGAFTLQDWVLIATLVYTVLQIALAIRRFWKER